MTNLKLEVIKYAKKLNDTNLSPLRSGNVSVRTDLSGKEGFFITPSGIKYNDLQEDKIVFLEISTPIPAEFFKFNNRLRIIQPVPVPISNIDTFLSLYIFNNLSTKSSVSGLGINTSLLT